MTFVSIDPSTGKPIAVYEQFDSERVAEILRRSALAQEEWRSSPWSTRCSAATDLAGRLREASEELAELIAKEMGKPRREGVAEVEKCAWACEYFAANAEKFLESETIETDATRSYVTFEPLGVILAIMPWNFPLWQVVRCAVPALLAGNSVILKHSPNVTGCALALERLFAEFPDDLFRTVLVSEERVAGLIESRPVRAVALTGSPRAGSAVAACAGRALKKTVLELGGSDPYLILADADLEAAAEACVTSRLINSGQSCIAAKRVLVPGEIAPRIEELLVTRMSEAVVGDPLDPASTVGPIARDDLRETLHRQVTESVRLGARLLLGGELPDGPGFFYPPSVLAGVAPGMPAYEEELFGPVIAVIPFADEDEAIRIANDTSYGLGAAVFTRDRSRGEELAARRLEAGSCFVNDFVRSDPRLPFGGVKRSGYGRELGPQGIREFVNVKTVYVA